MDATNTANGKESDESRFDQFQYDFLKKCSEKGEEGIKEWNEWRRQNPLQDVLLDGAFLREWWLCGVNFGTLSPRLIPLTEGKKASYAYLSGAQLQGARMEGATFELAHLEMASLHRAHLESAYLQYAHLQHASLPETYLQGATLDMAHLEQANFARAIVDGATSFWRCYVGRETDFSGVGLAGARIDPATRQLLEYNIRRMNWEQWYRDTDEPSRFARLVSSNQRIGQFVDKVLRVPVRLFWGASDYGTSAGRIVKTFVVVWGLFAVFYRLWPSCIAVNGRVGDLRGFIHALYFSMMAMIGVGDVGPNPESRPGQVFLIVQVVSGYVLLAALVTRFAVLFTAGGPPGRFAEGGAGHGSSTPRAPSKR